MVVQQLYPIKEGMQQLLHAGLVWRFCSKDARNTGRGIASSQCDITLQNRLCIMGKFCEPATPVAVGLSDHKPVCCRTSAEFNHQCRLRVTCSVLAGHWRQLLGPAQPRDNFLCRPPAQAVLSLMAGSRPIHKFVAKYFMSPSLPCHTRLSTFCPC